MSKSDPRSLSVRAIIAFYREFERVMRDGDISLAQYRTMLYLKGGAKRVGLRDDVNREYWRCRL